MGRGAGGRGGAGRAAVGPRTVHGVTARANALMDFDELWNGELENIYSSREGFEDYEANPEMYLTDFIRSNTDWDALGNFSVPDQVDISIAAVEDLTSDGWYIAPYQEGRTPPWRGL